MALGIVKRAILATKVTKPFENCVWGAYRASKIELPSYPLCLFFQHKKNYENIF